MFSILLHLFLAGFCLSSCVCLVQFCPLSCAAARALLGCQQLQISDLGSYVCVMLEVWRIRFRSIWIPDPADHSATMEACVKEWMRESSSGGKPAHEDFSRSPSQHHRSRPRLQSRTSGTRPQDVSLDHSATEDPGPVAGAEPRRLRLKS